MTDCKKLCAELVRIADAFDGGNPLVANQGQALDGYSALAAFRGIAASVRAALAEPEPEGPTDEELERWYSDCADETTMGSAEHYWAFEVPIDYANDLARAVLARWGK